MLYDIIAVVYAIIIVLATGFGILMLNRLIIVIDEYLKEKNDIRRFSTNISSSNDTEIIKILDDLIDNTIAEYYALNIGYTSTSVINSKMEEDMQKDVAKMVGERVSEVMIDKLTLYYSRQSINDIIASKCFIKITDFVMSVNRPK